VGLADQLRASGRAGPAVSAVFGIVPRHAFLPQIEAENAYQDSAIVIKSDASGLPVSASTQPAIMAIMLGQLGLANGQRVLEIGTGTGYNAALIAEIIGDPNAVGGLRPDPILWSELWVATCGCCRLGWRKWSQLKNTGRQGR
jgi:protein-L-isoaspartate(D-aspartate) O-methyltransferase